MQVWMWDCGIFSIWAWASASHKCGKNMDVVGGMRFLKTLTPLQPVAVDWDEAMGAIVPSTVEKEDEK